MVPGGDEGGIHVLGAGGDTQGVGNVIHALPCLIAAFLTVQESQRLVLADQVVQDRWVCHEHG
ncbi:hypothetical protein NKH18_46225 [Streptomyces sp. M10(2022)]